MKMGVFFLGLFLSFSSFSQDAGSYRVNIKNGNFNVVFRDAHFLGGLEPKIERVYNSKSVYSGLFGRGWGTEYEVVLQELPDGTVSVQDYGGGAESVFRPVTKTKFSLDQAVSQIVNAAKQTKMFGTEKQYQDYEKNLKSNIDFRNSEWQKFLSQKRVKGVDLKEGTIFESIKYSLQKLRKEKNGYTRLYETGKRERFDSDGNMIEVRDRNNQWMKFSYNKDRKMIRIEDHLQRKINLSYDSSGRVSEIQADGKKAKYDYTKTGELSVSQDLAGNTYRYAYDKRWNLTKIAYQDKTSLDMDYYGEDKFDSIKRIKERDGTVTEYAYEFGKNDQGHRKIGTVLKDAKGNKLSEKYYEYFIKNKKDGEEWTYRLISKIDGVTTDTIYNECCGLPLVIKRNKQETSFKYDDKGRVTEKSTPYEVTMLKYDPKVGKVSASMVISKSNSKDKSWSKFRYDQKGNLVYAENSSKKRVKLAYDRNGRMISMMDQKNRKINFQYNEQSKPVKISDPKLGSIKVTYNSNGTVGRVDSDQGRQVASQISESFQSLMDIVAPAGVSLSF